MHAAMSPSQPNDRVAKGTPIISNSLEDQDQANNPSTTTSKNTNSTGQVGQEADNNDNKARIGEVQDTNNEDGLTVSNDEWQILWPGWAEIENDPSVFTIIVREWGLQNVEVNDVFDLGEILISDEKRTLLGLIFLSKWLPPTISNDNNNTDTLTQAVPSEKSTTHAQQKRPWFANQISKFSCGTIALLNVVFNSNIDLTTALTLNRLREACSNKTPKQCGLLLDSNVSLRSIHNSFSTSLDRKIVDVALKDDVQADQRRKRLETEGDSRKRKSTRTNFSRKKRRKVDRGDDEHSYHFVSYIPYGGHVWRLDGMERCPQMIAEVSEHASWPEVAAQDVARQMEKIQDQGLDYSLMSVTQSMMDGVINTSQAVQYATTERNRRQDDWAPFIEQMLHLHAEKGDLNEMLGL